MSLQQLDTRTQDNVGLRPVAQHGFKEGQGIERRGKVRISEAYIFWVELKSLKNTLADGFGLSDVEG